MANPYILDEKLITLAAAARRFPGCRGVEFVNPSTLWRWARKGSRSAAGHVVTLRVIKAGVRWLTTETAIREFCEELSALPADGEVTRPNCPSARNKASRAAEAKAIAMGC